MMHAVPSNPAFVRDEVTGMLEFTECGFRTLHEELKKCGQVQIGPNVLFDYISFYTWQQHNLRADEYFIALIESESPSVDLSGHRLIKAKPQSAKQTCCSHITQRDVLLLCVAVALMYHSSEILQVVALWIFWMLVGSLSLTGLITCASFVGRRLFP